MAMRWATVRRQSVCEGFREYKYKMWHKERRVLFKR
jgi:hypothetical protein